MIDLVRLIDVLARVEFPGFALLAEFTDDTYWLRVVHRGTCNTTGNPLEWKGRKWVLSRHMTDGEIVQTAFKAVLTAIEHETREQFKYRGVAVFDPHYDIEKLVELRRDPASIKERA